MSQEKDKLLKRIQKLVRRNQELIEENEKLRNAIEELRESVDTLKQRRGTTISETGEDQTIRKFNMATVLFANIEGFYKITDDTDSTSLMDRLDEVLIGFDEILKILQCIVIIISSKPADFKLDSQF